MYKKTEILGSGSFSVELFEKLESLRESVFVRDFNDAIGAIVDLFIEEMSGSRMENETVGAGGAYIPFKGQAGFIFIWKAERASKWFFWKKKHLHKSVLHITNAHIYRSVPGVSMGTGIKDNDPPGIGCELYLSDPHLREIAQRVLDPYVEENGFLPVEYIDMSNEPSAWYPGERPELPKARLLHAP